MTDKQRRQVNIRLEPELFHFLVSYAKENYKTVTGVIRGIIADLYKAHEERLAVDENGKVVLTKGK